MNESSDSGIQKSLPVHRALPWILAAVVLASYAGVIFSGFVWDDRILLLSGERFATASLGDLLFQDLWEDVPFVGRSGYFRPVMMFSLWVDLSLFGVGFPGGWHLHSLAWHLASCAVLYRLVSRAVFSLGFPPISGILAVSFFALHPVQSEAIIWVVSRNDLLATFFSLCCVYCLRVFDEEPIGRARAWAAAALYVLALWSKESAVAIPLLAFGLAWSAGRGPGLPSLRPIVPCAVGLLVALAPRWIIPPLTEHDTLLKGVNTLLRGPEILGLYGSLVGVPWPLLTTRSLNFDPVGVGPRELAGILLSLGIPVLCYGVLASGARRVAFVALGGFALTLMPSGLAIARTGLLSERYLYLPLAWLCFALLPLAARLRAVRWLLTVFLVASGAILQVRVPEWQDEVSLFSAESSRSPNCRNRTLLAQSWLNLRNADLALGVLQKTLREDPGCQDAFPMAVTAALLAGQPTVAVSLAEEGRAQGLDRSAAFTGQYAWALAVAGFWDRADAAGRQALELRPAGQGATVVAAARWRAGDLLAWQAILSRSGEPEVLETWAVRLLHLAGDTESAERLRKAGADPARVVRAVEIWDDRF